MPQKPQPAPGALGLELAAIIRAQIARKQVTDASVAQKAGISAPQFSRMIAGTKRIDIEELDRILFALDLPLKKTLADADAATENRHLPSAPTS